MPISLTTEEIKYLKELVAAGERGRTIAAQRMTSFFKCVEMTRSLAAVSKNDAGSNSASRAALRSQEAKVVSFEQSWSFPRAKLVTSPKQLRAPVNSQTVSRSSPYLVGGEDEYRSYPIFIF